MYLTPDAKRGVLYIFWRACDEWTDFGAFRSYDAADTVSSNSNTLILSQTNRWQFLCYACMNITQNYWGRRNWVTEHSEAFDLKKKQIAVFVLYRSVKVSVKVSFMMSPLLLSHPESKSDPEWSLCPAVWGRASINRPVFTI